MWGSSVKNVLNYFQLTVEEYVSSLEKLTTGTAGTLYTLQQIISKIFALSDNRIVIYVI